MTSSERVLLAIAFAAFASLGLPDGVLGIAWPSVRRSFGLALSDLGALLASATAGYLASAFASGPAVARLGVGRLLAASSGAMVAASLGYALAPSWPAMVALGALTGLGAGAIDAGINAFAAARFAPGQVSWLHACYGVGATLGPLLMTAVVTGGWSWRWGYAIIGAVLAGMTAAFTLTVQRWSLEAPTGRAAPCMASLGATLRRPSAWINAAIFFAYTGIEVTAGQWAFTLLTEGRHVGAALAGGAVATYWSSLTAGRIAFGALAHRHAPERLLRLALVAAPAAAAMLALVPNAVASLASLAALGFALAPVFPFLIALTPARVGAVHATNAVGLQVAAAYVGAAVIPGATGILAQRFGLEAIGAAVFAGALAVLVLEHLGRRAATPE